METKQYKIYDAVKTVQDKRKSEHKGWFDSWNDRYGESFKESVKPIVDVLQKIGCDEQQTDDMFEYSYKDTNGVPHVVFRLMLKPSRLDIRSFRNLCHPMKIAKHLMRENSLHITRIR